MEEKKERQIPNNKPGKLKVSSLLVLLTSLILSFVFSTSYAYRSVSKTIDTGDADYVLVNGNVKKPGYYKINELTTQYELLAQAGITDSSNIQEFDLGRSIRVNDRINVGVADNKIKKKDISSYSEPRLEFFMGKTSVKRNLKVSKAQYKQSLKVKDLIFTQKNGKAVLTFKNHSELSMATNTRIRFKSIESNGSSQETKIDLLRGSILIKVPELKAKGQLNVRTKIANIYLSEQNSSISVRVGRTKMAVFVLRGRVKVKRRFDGASTVLKANEQIVINLPDEEFESEELAELIPVQKNGLKEKLEGNFSELVRSHKEYLKSQEETSIFVVSKGFSFILSLIPKKGRVILMDLPGNTYVGEYVDGIYRLDQAQLALGAELTREVVQRMIGRPIDYVVNISYSNVFELVYILDGISVDVDEVAANKMRISKGRQRLSEKQLIKYLDPRLSGARTRQKKLLLSLFSALKEGGLSSYNKYFLPILKATQTNISLKDGGKLFKIYRSIPSWQVVSSTLPSSVFMKGPVVLGKPKYDQIQKIYN